MPSRDAIALTYFRIRHLAALWIFAQNKLDVAVLEVGLGGRLDAVNIVDADDAAIVTTVDLDHQDWLGNDRDSIGYEKAGHFPRCAAGDLGMREPPADCWRRRPPRRGCPSGRHRLRLQSAGVGVAMAVRRGDHRLAGADVAAPCQTSKPLRRFAAS
jgi:hypothetical protein